MCQATGRSGIKNGMDASCFLAKEEELFRGESRGKKVPRYAKMCPVPVKTSWRLRWTQRYRSQRRSNV
jgi:hypothetical protein